MLDKKDKSSIDAAIGHVNDIPTLKRNMEKETQ